MPPANDRDRRLGGPQVRSASSSFGRPPAGVKQVAVDGRRISGESQRPRMRLGRHAGLARDNERREPSKAAGRPGGAICFLLVETLAMAGQKRPHDRVLGLPGLDQGAARRLNLRPPARLPAGGVERSARRRRVSRCRPISASITPTTERCGKLSPLVTSWVPITMSHSRRAIASISARRRSVPPGKSDRQGEFRPAGKRAFPRPDARCRGRRRRGWPAPDRPGKFRGLLRHGRNDGTSRPAGTGARQATRCNPGTETGARKTGTT